MADDPLGEGETVAVVDDRLEDVPSDDDVEGDLTGPKYHEWQQGREAPGTSTVIKRFDGKWSKAVAAAEQYRELVAND